MVKNSLIIAVILCISIGLLIELFSFPDDIESSTTSPTKEYSSSPINNASKDNEKISSPKMNINEQIINIPQIDEFAIRKPLHDLRAGNSRYIEVRNGHITLRAENQSLKKVLEDLARESGIQINTQLVTDRLLSVQFVQAPLDRALRTILEFEDSFFAFENRGKTNAHLKAVWVLPASTVGNWLPQASVCSQEVSELEKQLTAEQSTQRAEAIEALILIQGPDASQAIVQSLSDPDEDVRYRTLLKANVTNLAIPPEVLTEIIHYDNSEQVRMVALEAIGNHPSINEQEKIAFAQNAISDLNPAVQTKAAEILSHLEFGPLFRKQEQEFYEMIKQEEFHEIPDGSMSDQDRQSW